MSNVHLHCDERNAALKQRISLLEKIGREMAKDLAFLSGYLRERLAEKDTARMLQIAKDWYELVPVKE